MKMPPPLPSLQDLDSAEQVMKILELVSSGAGNLPKDRYVHWSKLKYMQPPDGISNEDWWLAIKFARGSVRHELPLVDKNGRPFSFSDSGYLNRMLHQVDRDAGGRIELPVDVVDPQSRNRYLVNSLIEEAITSSQLEGAATTRRVARAGDQGRKDDCQQLPRHGVPSRTRRGESVNALAAGSAEHSHRGHSKR